MNRIKVLWIGSGVLLALLSIAAVMARHPYQFHGSLIDPAQPASPINLVDQNGRGFQLAGQRGRVALIYFGYTNCTDACPATLNLMNEVRANLGKADDKVRVVFVTVDPEWDTQARLKDYLAAFDPSFVGLTGSLNQLQDVWKGYGVLAERDQAIGKTAETVNHTTALYLVDPQGNLRLTYTADFAVADLVADVRQLLK